MTERYNRIYILPSKFYTPSSPAIIEAAALLCDNQTGKLLVQLKIKNIQSIPLKMITAEVTPMDPVGRPVGTPIIHKYIDLTATRDTSFGSQQPIIIPYADARSFKVKITEICFEDNTVWASSEEWIPLPDIRPIESLISDSELVKQYQMTYGADAKYCAETVNDLWYCTCGAINKQEENICHNCENLHSDVLQPDIEMLTSTMRIRLEEEIAKEEHERLEIARKAEEQRIAREKRKKKIKKIAVIVMPIVAAVVIFSVLVNMIIIPNNKYNNAVKMMEVGNTIEAYEAFLALDDYKDSTDKANQILEEYLIEKYKYAEVGDSVFFGAYEQDNKTLNGKEDIEWIILEKEDDRLFVISKYSLYSEPYNLTNEDVTWESCTLRKWLNNAFINAAFSELEKPLIQTVTVSADKNPQYSTDPGNATQDKVFLLSIIETEKYFTTDKSLRCALTPYAKAQGGIASDYYKTENYEAACWWWLRSPGSVQYAAEAFQDNGRLHENSYRVDCEGIGVRPALWIGLNNL